MSKKKKPSGKHPAMFYQEGLAYNNFWERTLSFGPRIRIVYPNGQIEWSTLVEGYYDDFNKFSFEALPCYLSDNFLTKARNFKDAIRIITEYDNENEFPEMIFIGEL